MCVEERPSDRARDIETEKLTGIKSKAREPESNKQKAEQQGSIQLKAKKPIEKINKAKILVHPKGQYNCQVSTKSDKN